MGRTGTRIPFMIDVISGHDSIVHPSLFGCQVVRVLPPNPPIDR